MANTGNWTPNILILSLTPATSQKTYIPTTWESIGYADGNVLNPAKFNTFPIHTQWIPRVVWAYVFVQWPYPQGYVLPQYNYIKKLWLKIMLKDMSLSQV